MSVNAGRLRLRMYQSANRPNISPRLNLWLAAVSPGTERASAKTDNTYQEKIPSSPAAYRQTWISRSNAWPWAKYQPDRCAGEHRREVRRSWK